MNKKERHKSRSREVKYFSADIKDKERHIYGTALRPKMSFVTTSIKDSAV